MRGFPLNHGYYGLFTYLVLFSLLPVTTAVSFDLTELRNKVAKIKVNPRGNLWATGHFMGKKSVMDSPLQADERGRDEMEMSFGAEHNGLDDLFQEVMRVALKARVNTQERRTKNLDTALLMKILENYLQSNRK